MRYRTPNGDGLQCSGGGLQPSSHGLHPNCFEIWAYPVPVRVDDGLVARRHL